MTNALAVPKKRHGFTVFAAVLIVVASLLLSCTSKKDEPKTRGYEVADAFDTGPGVVVRALKTDGPYLWVGTNIGIVQVDRKTGDLIRTYTKEDGLLSSYIFTINVSQDGIRWFGTDAGGLSRFNGQDWKNYMPEDGLADEWVYDIDFDHEGGMWVGTWDGVSRFDGTGFRTYKVSDGLANKWVYGVATDQDGTLWFGTEEGVSHYHPKENRWVTYTHADGLGAPNEKALSRKQTRGEAFESARKGEIELAPGRSYEGHFHDLSPLDEEGNDTYNENYIFAILIDRHGTKWFGTWGGGVSRFDGESWTNYTVQEGLAGNIIYSIEEDELGQIWVGTHKGVSVYDGRVWKSYTQENGIKAGDVFAVAADSDHRIWLGQNGRVVQLRERRG